eukprot:gene4240-4290_t
MDFSSLVGCARAFWHITSGLCRAVGACLGGGGRPATLPQDLVMEAHRRVALAQNRLLALMERVRTGRLRHGLSRVVSASVKPRVPRVSAPAQMVLPRRFGWLVHLVGHEAAGRGSQLAHLLGDPEMVALVRDVPQARRILAPLCRMLGVECDGLRAATRVRVRKVRVVEAVVAAVEATASMRVGYVPSAKWPRGVISRGVVRLKPGGLLGSLDWPFELVAVFAAKQAVG